MSPFPTADVLGRLYNLVRELVPTAPVKGVSILASLLAGTSSLTEPAVSAALADLATRVTPYLGGEPWAVEALKALAGPPTAAIGPGIIERARAADARRAERERVAREADDLAAQLDQLFAGVRVELVHVGTISGPVR